MKSVWDAVAEDKEPSAKRLMGLQNIPAGIIQTLNNYQVTRATTFLVASSYLNVAKRKIEDRKKKQK